MHRTIACSIQVTLSHVVVPRGHGEIARDLVVVEVVSPRQPTQIGCNELAPVCLAAYGLKLYLLKVAPCLRHKVAMLKQQSRIAAAGNKRNLIPAIIGLAPVRGGPVLIERIERAEAPPQPLLKLRKGRGIEGLVSVLVADLPSDHITIVSETLRHSSRDVSTEDPVTRAGIVKLAAATVFCAPAVRIYTQSIGVLRCEPGWGRIGGRA